MNVKCSVRAVYGNRDATERPLETIHNEYYCRKYFPGYWYLSRIGMGIIENSTVRFGSRFCFYGSVLSRFPKRFINDISWIRNYAMECVAELA